MESWVGEERNFSVDYGVRPDDPLKDKIHELVVTPYTESRSRKVVYRVEQYRVCDDGKIHLVLVAKQVSEYPLRPDDPAVHLYVQGGNYARDMR